MRWRGPATVRVLALSGVQLAALCAGDAAVAARRSRDRCIALTSAVEFRRLLSSDTPPSTTKALHPWHLAVRRRCHAGGRPGCCRLDRGNATSSASRYTVSARPRSLASRSCRPCPPRAACTGAASIGSRSPMPENTRFALRSVSVVVTAEFHNPSILNPDFLKTHEIVPADWDGCGNADDAAGLGREVRRRGSSGPSIRSRLTIAENRGPAFDGRLPGPPACGRVPAGGLPYVPYRGLGLNWQVSLEQAGPERWLVERFGASWLADEPKVARDETELRVERRRRCRVLHRARRRAAWPRPDRRELQRASPDAAGCRRVVHGRRTLAPSDKHSSARRWPRSSGAEACVGPTQPRARLSRMSAGRPCSRLWLGGSSRQARPVTRVPPGPGRHRQVRVRSSLTVCVFSRSSRRGCFGGALDSSPADPASRLIHRIVAATRHDEIIAVLRLLEIRGIADRLGYLHDVSLDGDPDEPPMALDSAAGAGPLLREGAAHWNDPEIGISPDGLMQAEWRVGRGILAMKFLPGGFIQFAAVSRPGGDHPPLSVHGTLPKDQAMGALQAFAGRGMP